MFFCSCFSSVLNINSFIKYFTIIVGMIGLIFTGYRIFDEHQTNSPKPVLPVATAPPAAAAPIVVESVSAKVRSANLQAQAPPAMPEKY